MKTFGQKAGQGSPITVRQIGCQLFLSCYEASIFFEVDNCVDAFGGLNALPEQVRHAVSSARYLCRKMARMSSAREEELVEELRHFARALRPPTLDDLGLATSIRRLLVELAERTKLDGQLKITGSEQRLPPDTELALFRIAQEALRNVERHAHATHVTVSISFAKDQVRLDVFDNGVGFTLPTELDFAAIGHLGLVGMRERAETLGGSLEIQSNPGYGVRVTAHIAGEAVAYHQ